MTAHNTKKNKDAGIVRVVGIGPGALDLLAPRALAALQGAEVIIGYRTYLELVESCFNPEAEVISSAMMQEIDRCRKALELAQNGRDVALVCGGDPGIYAMAGLVFELAKNQANTCAIEIIPGIAALNACAAVLGAPLMHDFAAISLSDLLTPWELIEKRLEAAAAADFVTVLYNPKSKKRTSQIERAQEIFLVHRDAATPVGIVHAAGRGDESVQLRTLADMLKAEIGMQSTVTIGNSQTFIWQNRMVTPRGYAGKYEL
ncbi:MAG: precorrin-3B C(17)-methyltransferase [bacterium]|nr:precorrin-3B C(17)-methyltransferase [bacterium]